MLPNPYAAVPSLHTAYSLLTFVFALAWLGRMGWAFVGYPLVMWFTIVYFADHYVADIVVGAGMALAAWWLAGRLVRPGGRLAALAGPFPPLLASARTFGGRRP
jgi:membrane-associated phospholipid phosphatase